MANDNAEVTAARSALIRAIGAWADAREAYARCTETANRELRDAAHVEMLVAVDAYGAARERFGSLLLGKAT